MSGKIFILFLFVLNTIYCQTMRIVEDPKPRGDQLIDKNIRDANGNVCAGIIIESDLENLKFESANHIVKENSNLNRPGSYFLFISPSESVITIYKGGFNPLRIVLRDHKIINLKSGSVWQIKVTGDVKPSLIPVNIIVEPVADQLIIDGKVDKSNPFQLEVGEHKIRIEKDGYKTIEEKITVSTSNNLFNYTLAEVELVRIKLTSFPSSARIYIDNILKGETSKELFLFPGKYNLKLVKTGFVEKQDVIEVIEGQEKIVSDTLIRNIGQLSLKINPIDARVLIDGDDYTYKNQIELIPGKHKIEINKPGYAEINEMVTITVGQTTVRQYDLPERSGLINVTVQPENASIILRINGEEIYRLGGSQMERKVAIGDYDLEILADGYQSFIKHITVIEGKSLKENIALKKNTN